MLVEHARATMGMLDAVHAEYGEPGTQVVSALRCSLNGVDIELLIRPDSRLHQLYGGATGVVERATCNYGLNPDFQRSLEESGMIVSATDDTREARAVELLDHPYFIATLYQPQLRSTPASPHPVLVGLVNAAA